MIHRNFKEYLSSLNPGSAKNVGPGMPPLHQPFDLAQGGEHVEPHVNQAFRYLALREQ